MGGVIIDGRAGLLFKGGISEFEKVIVSLKKLNEQSKGLKIDTVPLPDKSATVIRMQFRGPMSEFENVVTGLEKLRASVAIYTVPLLEFPAIGTWPTPERRATALSWVISATTKVQQKRR
jgi:hypothetical protein